MEIVVKRWSLKIALFKTKLSEPDKMAFRLEKSLNRFLGYDGLEGYKKLFKID